MRKIVTEQVYEAIKLMLNGGASVSECAKFTGFTPTTIYLVRRAKTFEEYKQLVFDNCGRYHAAFKNEQPEIQEEDLFLKGSSLTLNSIYGGLRILITEQKKTNELLSCLLDELKR